MFRIVFCIICFVCWRFLVSYPMMQSSIFLEFLFIPLLSFFISLCLFLFVGILIMRILKPNHNFKKIFMCHLSKFLLSIMRVKVVIKKSDSISLNKKLIIYANHKSWLDALILLSISPRCLSFTPKSELYRIPILCFILNSMNCIKIFRNDKRLTIQNLMHGMENVKHGLSFVVFPEGGIKDCHKDALTDFLPGSLKIAFKSQADILPVSIKGIAHIQKKISIFKRNKVEVYFHPVLKFADYNQKNTNQISQQMTEIINSVL